MSNGQEKPIRLTLLDQAKALEPFRRDAVLKAAEGVTEDLAVALRDGNRERAHQLIATLGGLVLADQLVEHALADRLP